MPPRTRKAAAPSSSTGAATGTGAAAGTTSRAKRAAGLSQPTLSFQSQRPISLSGKDKTKSKSKANSTSRPSILTTPSLSEIEVDAGDNVEVTEAPSDLEVKEIKHVTGQKQHEHEQHQGRRQLDVKSKEWKGLVRSYKEAMGGMRPIHAGPDTHNDIHHILRVFDMTSSYGPCVGITRLQRWERAKKWGLNPPEEIRTILTTEQGEDDVRYRETVLHGWV
ncbi:hypothetical protein IAU59_001521 [Kwoniella sp. CBS 9459]